MSVSVYLSVRAWHISKTSRPINQSINQSIRALMQADKPQRNRVNEYITVYYVKNNDNLDLNMHTDGKMK